MTGQVIRNLTPEEEELLRKREELSDLRAKLAERELDLVEYRSQLAAFEGRYLRQVGVQYAELDEWRARVVELQARLRPSVGTEQQATEARQQARRTYEDAHRRASENAERSPSPELRKLFRDIARGIHPDLAKDMADLERRTRLMAEANRAYQVGDIEELKRIIGEYHLGADAVAGEGTGAELVRTIRQISAVRTRLGVIEQELTALHRSEIATLKKQADEWQQEGRDFLAELATSVIAQIDRVKQDWDEVSKQGIDQ